MRCEVNLNSLGREILSKRQRKVLIFAFLELENCTWRLTLGSLFCWEKPSRKKKPRCQMRRHAVKAGDTRPRWVGLGGAMGAELYAISALVSFACIIHVTPTNYLGIAPGKRRNAVDLLAGIFSHLHHAAQSRLQCWRRELTFLRYGEIEVIHLCVTRCSSGLMWTPPPPQTVYEILFWICIPCTSLDIIRNAQLLNYRQWRGKMTQHTASRTPGLVWPWCMFSIVLFLQITPGMHCGCTVA